MRYGVDVINFGAYGEPSVIQEVARATEAAGWDGLFVWDHIAAAWAGEGPATGDPWVLLTAAGCVTSRIRLGTNVTPVPRRRPHTLAGQVTTLDRLSNGRVVLGVGLGGVVEEYERFGEPTDAKVRAEMLDEALEVITGLWSGECVRHHGRHFTVDAVRSRLVPVQRPRPPVWVGGSSLAALHRASHWDGWTCGLTVDERGRVSLLPQVLASKVQTILASRRSATPFDVVVAGYTEPSSSGAGLVADYQQAGATWWLESINGFRGSTEQMLERVAAGPPYR